MLQYADTYTCIVNDTKSALIIKFYQKEPVIKENSTDIETIDHEIASIVMPYDCAIALSNSMSELVEHMTKRQ